MSWWQGSRWPVDDPWFFIGVPTYISVLAFLGSQRQGINSYYMVVASKNVGLQENKIIKNICQINFIRLGSPLLMATASPSNVGFMLRRPEIQSFYIFSETAKSRITDVRKKNVSQIGINEVQFKPRFHICKQHSEAGRRHSSTYLLPGKDWGKERIA